MKKERLDIIVQRQTSFSPSQAQGLIHTGRVHSQTGERLDKPGMRLPEDTVVEIAEGPRFVSRGGEKLQEAMSAFKIDVEGLVAIDVGASTGGFTDCLLQHGAARVYAVDVGYGQLAWKLRQDERVVVMERTNIRHLKPESIPEQPGFFTVDCSFISLTKVLPPIMPLLSETASGVALIKPQFEAERDQVERGGVVRDPKIHDEVIDKIRNFAHKIGFAQFDLVPSPLLGPAGNREFLAYLKNRTG